jgi:hypothetical protein
VSLHPAILGYGVISGVSLAPSIFGPGAISGASIAPSVFGSGAISGASIAANARYESVRFFFKNDISGVTLSGTTGIVFSQVTPFFPAGVSQFTTVQASGTLKGVDLIVHPAQSVGSGVTVQIYRANKAFPSTSSGGILAGAGVSVVSSGVTCFDSWASGGTTFNVGDVLVANVESGVSSSTVKWFSLILKYLLD